MMIANVKGPLLQGFGSLAPGDESGPRQTIAWRPTIEAASIHTRDEQRDAHLKSADFFPTLKSFPTLHFKSTGINVVGEGEIGGGRRPDDPGG